MTFLMSRVDLDSERGSLFGRAYSVSGIGNWSSERCPGIDSNEHAE